MFDAQEADLMQTPITWQQMVSRDAYGVPTMGATRSLVAKVSYKTMIVRGNVEENAHSTAQVVIPPPNWIPLGDPTETAYPTIAVDDRITLPDGVQRRVLSVSMPFDESGTPHHQSASLT